MTRDERRKFRKEFRTAAYQALERLHEAGEITRIQYGWAALRLINGRKVDRAASLCLERAVKCGLVESSETNPSNVMWSQLVREIDIEKLMEFFLMILPMFL